MAPEPAHTQDGAAEAVQFEISDFGFEMGFRPISKFLLDQDCVSPKILSKKQTTTAAFDKPLPIATVSVI